MSKVREIVIYLGNPGSISKHPVIRISQHFGLYAKLDPRGGDRGHFVILAVSNAEMVALTLALDPCAGKLPQAKG